MSHLVSDAPYDIIVIGGALSGASTALLAKRKAPELRILIVERSDSFQRRVGESTVEISSYFLGKVLGLADYLQEHHLNKQGLRFWFQNEDGTCLDSCSEIGPHYNVKLSSFQVDRSKLDEHVLTLCLKEGIELLRPCEVKDFELHAGGMQQVTLKDGDSVRRLSARWVVDGSGVSKLIARKSGWVKRNADHPVSAAWVRWNGVKSWDDSEIRERFPDFGQRCYASRNTATNHLMGQGWWAWWIPLNGGDVSIGIVYDERLVTLPAGDRPIDRFKGLLYQHPIAPILLEGATCIEGDFHWRRHVAYSSKKVMGDGFALVGDAAAFIDPFYSSGIDWISFTSYGTADLIVKERQNKAVAKDFEARNELLLGSYQCWFESIYKNKYYYMGDWELMRLGFQLDLGMYYLGLVSQPYKYGDDSFNAVPLNGPYTRFPAWLIATYNRRLAMIGKVRMQRKTWGKRNNGHYFPFNSFSFDKSLPLRVIGTLFAWFLLELKEGWRSWGCSVKKLPIPQQPEAPAQDSHATQ
jgi:flavin-dependent dehydrogenase